MSVSEHSTAVPHDGDVLVTCEATGRARFSIRQVPGGPQLTAPSLDRALWIARGFARRQAVDLWYGEAGRLRRLENYRHLSTATPVSPDACQTDRD